MKLPYRTIKIEEVVICYRNLTKYFPFTSYWNYDFCSSNGRNANLEKAIW